MKKYLLSILALLLLVPANIFCMDDDDDFDSDYEDERAELFNPSYQPQMQMPMAGAAGAKPKAAVAVPKKEKAPSEKSKSWAPSWGTVGKLGVGAAGLYGLHKAGGDKAAMAGLGAYLALQAKKGYAARQKKNMEDLYEDLTTGKAYADPEDKIHHLKYLADMFKGISWNTFGHQQGSRCQQDPQCQRLMQSLMRDVKIDLGSKHERTLGQNAYDTNYTDFIKELDQEAEFLDSLKRQYLLPENALMAEIRSFDTDLNILEFDKRYRKEERSTLRPWKKENVGFDQDKLEHRIALIVRTYEKAYPVIKQILEGTNPQAIRPFS